MRNALVLLAAIVLALLWRRREPEIPAEYPQRDDYLWSILSGGEDR